MLDQPSQVEAIDHISLTVSNIENSFHFYNDILGFRLERTTSTCYFSVGDTEITLIKHAQTPPSDTFSELRVGLDHISFRVSSIEMLENIVERLNTHGVKNTGIQNYHPNSKKYVVTRDPDNIQLEYWFN